MNGLRPEAVAATLRWAEIILTGTAAVWLLRESYQAYLSSSPTLILTLVGAGFAGLWSGVTLMRMMVRNATAQDALGAPGIVTVQEGRIGYFGPEGGGFIAIDALVQIDLVAAFERGQGGLDWRFKDEFGHMLQIPAGAQGAERIIDAIGVLADLDYQSLLSAGLGKGAGIYPVWRRGTGLSLPGSSPASGS
ncbi:MAG: hypothetical protein AAGC81_01250 [Pseudomonadota bacterium]